jgi:hypothetical protein
MISSVDRAKISEVCLRSLCVSIKEIGINIVFLRFLVWFVLLLSLKEHFGCRCQ